MSDAPCPCGGLLVAAIRYEASQTVDVVACFDCGSESPPFVQPPSLLPKRQYRRPVLGFGSCEWCDGPVPITSKHRELRFCSLRCAASSGNAARRTA